MNEQLKRTKYLNIITPTKRFKNCNKKLEFVDQHSTAGYSQFLQKNPYFFPQQ